MRYILEATPNCVSSHGDTQDMELLSKLQLVGELLYIQGFTFDTPTGVWVTFPVPCSIKCKEVNFEFFHELLIMAKTEIFRENIER